MITETLELIKNQIGLDLELCDCFSGVKTLNGKKYFNIVFNQRISESQEYSKLEAFSKKSKHINVEPNGLKRASIFVN